MVYDKGRVTEGDGDHMSSATALFRINEGREEASSDATSLQE